MCPAVIPEKGVSSLRQYPGQECRTLYNHKEIAKGGKFFGEEKKTNKQVCGRETRYSPKMSQTKRQEVRKNFPDQRSHERYNK